MAEKPKISTENITDGLSLFVVGIFKKVALADYLALDPEHGAMKVPYLLVVGQREEEQHGHHW